MCVGVCVCISSTLWSQLATLHTHYAVMQSLLGRHTQRWDHPSPISRTTYILQLSPKYTPTPAYLRRLLLPVPVYLPRYNHSPVTGRGRWIPCRFQTWWRSRWYPREEKGNRTVSTNLFFLASSPRSQKRILTCLDQKPSQEIVRLRSAFTGIAVP